MQMLAIDPGPEKSGIVWWDGSRVRNSGHYENGMVRALIRKGEFDRIACEMIASYGMAVGASVFGTCVEIGRFVEVANIAGVRVEMVFRKDVKLHLCGSSRAKDANVRQSLLDALGPVGTKKAQGPLYGVSGHAWAALAVAVTATNDARFLGRNVHHVPQGSARRAKRA